MIVDVFAERRIDRHRQQRDQTSNGLRAAIVRKEVNCMIIKSLARGFRNLADQQKFLEEFIPINGARFICTGTPFIDTYANPHLQAALKYLLGECSTSSLPRPLPKKSAKTFKMKRERGEFIGAFAPYGYKKDPKRQKQLDCR